MALNIRPGTLNDTYAVFEVFQAAVTDLARRLGLNTSGEPPDPEAVARNWQRRRPLLEYLAQTAHGFWVAESDNQLQGYARSILREDVLQLTEFFVRPDQQEQGIGRELLGRAFSSSTATRRIIIATLDVRAQSRYLRQGVYPQSPLCSLSHPAQKVEVASDLEFVPVDNEPSAPTLALLDEIDQVVLGYRRTAEHRWLLQQRPGFLYYRQGRAVGYGYMATDAGPFALLNGADYPAVLAHAEGEALAFGDDFVVDAPMINRSAVSYLLGRGFRIDPFYVFIMTDQPLARLENYITSSPPFFM